MYFKNDDSTNIQENQEEEGPEKRGKYSLDIIMKLDSQRDHSDNTERPKLKKMKKCMCSQENRRKRVHLAERKEEDATCFICQS